jgi:hypothetical protein
MSHLRQLQIFSGLQSRRHEANRVLHDTIGPSEQLSQQQTSNHNKPAALRACNI